MIFTFIMLSPVEGLSCTQRYECSSVTTNYNYADCVSGQCQCLAAFGFAGNATTNNKCACLTPYQVFWEGSNAFCIQYSDAVQFKLDKAKTDQQKASVQTIYQSLIYPAPFLIMTSLINHQPSFISSLFSPTAKGRVDPVGNFGDYEGLIEYFYGFVWLPFSTVDSIHINKLISQGNIVYVSVNTHFVQPDFLNTSNAPRLYNLTQSGTFTFDSNGLIISSDLIIHNLGASPGGNVADPNNIAQKTNTAISTCSFIMGAVTIPGIPFTGCNSTWDPTGYYANFTECVNYMITVFPFGSWDNVYFGGNSVACRTLHSLLAIGRPEHHCSHSGKTGGGKCINHDYQSYYLEDF